jgi:ABC-type enterochelin transport system permease subunit
MLTKNEHMKLLVHIKPQNHILLENVFALESRLSIFIIFCGGHCFHLEENKSQPP